MDLTFDDATEEFRAEVRDFLAANTRHVPDEVLRHRRGLRAAPALGQGALRRRPVGDRLARRSTAAATPRCCSGSCTRRSTSAPARPAGPAPTAPRCWRRRCSRTAPRSSSTACCRRWPAARRSGRRPGRSPSRAATWPRCARPRRRTDGGWLLNGQKIWSSRAPFGEQGIRAVPLRSRGAAPQGPDVRHVRPEGRRRHRAADRAARRRHRVRRDLPRRRLRARRRRHRRACTTAGAPR